MTVFPVASITVAPPASDRVGRPDGRDAVAVMTTDVRGRTTPFSLSKRSPFRMTSDRGALGVRRRAIAADFVTRRRTSIFRSAGSTLSAPRGSG